jgi:hypothetical protein
LFPTGDLLEEMGVQMDDSNASCNYWVPIARSVRCIIPKLIHIPQSIQNPSHLPRHICKTDLLIALVHCEVEKDPVEAIKFLELKGLYEGSDMNPDIVGEVHAENGGEK